MMFDVLQPRIFIYFKKPRVMAMGAKGTSQMAHANNGSYYQ